MYDCALSQRAALAFIAAGLCFAAAPAQAAINLELRPTVQVVTVGDTFSVDLYAVSSNPLALQSTSAIQMILSWNTAFVQLGAVDNTFSPLMTSDFVGGDPFGLNPPPFTGLPSDGDGIWTGLSFGGNPVVASAIGTLLTTFEFTALSPTAPTTLIDIPLLGGAGGFTAVYDGVTAGSDITGSLTGATITILPVPAPGGIAVLLAGMIGVRRRRRM